MERETHESRKLGNDIDETSLRGRSKSNETQLLVRTTSDPDFSTRGRLKFEILRIQYFIQCFGVAIKIFPSWLNELHNRISNRSEEDKISKNCPFVISVTVLRIEPLV